MTLCTCLAPPRWSVLCALHGPPLMGLLVLRPRDLAANVKAVV